MATTMLHVCIDEEIEAQATETLAALGLSMSDAVRAFLVRVVAEQRLPLPLEMPTAETRAAMAAADAIAGTRRDCGL